MSPDDCAAALRSFNRRYRAALASIDEDERADDLAHRAGPDGHSALDHVDHAARTIALIGSALHDVLTRIDPVVDASVIDDDSRDRRRNAGTSIESALDLLSLEVERLADRIDSTHGEQWARAATIAGNGRVTALELAQEAARTGAEHLRAAEVAMQAARRAG